MIRHVVTFALKPGVPDEKIRQVEADLAQLPGLIPQLLDYQFGHDLGLYPTNGGFAATAVVANPEDIALYMDHPEHVRISREVLGPLVEHKLAVQFEIDSLPDTTPRSAS